MSAEENACTCIKAASSIDLVTKLRGIDISVPGRAEGRRKEHRERWSICRLLSTFCHYSKINFPMTLVKCESPDFMLRLQDACIGIEHTDATLPDYEEVLSRWEKNYQSNVLDLGLFKIETPLSKQEKSEAAKGSLSGPGWEGDEPERNTARIIAVTVANKIEKLKTYSIDFDKYFLLIYNNSPYKGINVCTCIKYLRDSLQFHWLLEKRFDAIYMEINSSTMLEVTESGICQMQIHNLWH